MTAVVVRSVATQPALTGSPAASTLAKYVRNLGRCDKQVKGFSGLSGKSFGFEKDEQQASEQQSTLGDRGYVDLTIKEFGTTHIQ